MIIKINILYKSLGLLIFFKDSISSIYQFYIEDKLQHIVHGESFFYMFFFIDFA